MEMNSFRLVSLNMLLLVVLMLMAVKDAAGYYKRGYGRSFLNKNVYKRPSRYTPKARYTHYNWGKSHPQPHSNAIGIPVPVTINGDNFIDDIDAVSRFMPYGYQDSYLIPLEALLRDMAGYTGYKHNQLPQLIRNIKHEFYIGANRADPVLHAILKRYGFVYTGAGLGFGQLGVSVGQNEVNDIFQSLGLGGAPGNAYGNGLAPATGISSAQSPLPGTAGITDDLFDDFDNSLLGLMTDGTAGQARLADDPQLLVDDSEAANSDDATSSPDVTSSDDTTETNEVLGL